MRLTLLNQSKYRIPRKFLLDWCERMERLLPRRRLADRELVVVFMNSRPARQLNKQFRGKDYATDVLSFESDDPSVLGELVICPEVIARQAREHGLSTRLELGYMVLHGLLHLLGYEHEASEREAAKMYRLQDRVFEKLR